MKSLIQSFWNCGDNQIIEFAMIRARLNTHEQKVITLMLDECLTQEETAERMFLSVRKVQSLWKSGVDKLLGIPWVYAYAVELQKSS